MKKEKEKKEVNSKIIYAISGHLLKIKRNGLD